MIDQNTHPDPRDGLIKAYIALGILALALIILCCTSCTSTRKATSSTRDSVVIVKRDSVVLSFRDSIRWSFRDSIRWESRDSVVITQGEDGRILFRESFHWNNRTSDRTSELAATEQRLTHTASNDQVSRSHESEKEIIKQREQSLAERIRIRFADLVLLVSAILAISIYIKRKCFHN